MGQALSRHPPATWPCNKSIAYCVAMALWTPEPLDTVFLFGTGICEGSWEPVREAILEVDSDAQVEVSTHLSQGQRYWDEVRAANEAASFWFADLVHRRRRFEAFSQMTPEEFSRRNHLATTSDMERWRERVRQAQVEYAKIDLDVKEALVKHLKKAVDAETLRVRPQFWRLMDDERFAGNAWIITTNWDTALERAKEDHGIDEIKVDHIHGSTGRPERLLLPSEVVEEPYRSPEQREVLIHSLLPWVPLSWAKQICLYGLSLSVSDAELAQTLEMGFREHKVGPGTVVIMNVATQLDAIARRLRRLSGGDWKIECVDVDSSWRDSL